MDPYSSGEELVVKTRKPYTITKQRERWTEEEHNRFLDALKLYGRAWQRIEEHIGTKTAVQIRSHAQKFFTKLQKEANIKGVPIIHAIDIEIPPPRPKRKPTNPYPRKISVGAALTPQVGVKNVNIPSPISSSCQSKLTVDLEKEPEESCDDRQLSNNNEYRGKDNCSSAFTLVKTAPCSSTSPDDASTNKSCTFRQYVPLSKEASDDQNETVASQVTVEAKGIQSDCQQPLQDKAPSNIMNSYLTHEKSIHCKSLDELKQSEYLDKLSSADVLLQGSQNYPRNVPVHILDGSLGMSATPVASGTTTSQHSSSASRPSVHQTISSYHPILSQIQNQDDYQSFLHISSMFSSLIVSALSQNPASYAAAGFSATLWPIGVSREADPSLEQSKPTTSSPTPPSMAAIAAATVAAATAWWAAHGLLPLCAPLPPPPPPPFHPVSFNCSPAMNNGERLDQDHPAALGGHQQCSEALHEEQQHSIIKSSPVLSSSQSEASEDAKLGLDCAADATAPVAETEKEVADTVELDDGNKPKNKNLVDRSSCGSNTASSSDFDAYASEKVVTEGQDEKHVKEDKKGSEELDAAAGGGGAIHPVDPFSRRCRTTTNMNDSWKEVSEEGRLAFRALFSRQRLPQSFSPPHDVNNKGKRVPIQESAVEKDENGLRLDLNLNSKPCVGTCPHKPEVEDNPSLICETNEDGLLNMGLGHFKLKARRTGFKPYKRCSMEAKESRDEEKEPKRLRMEGKAST